MNVQCLIVDDEVELAQMTQEYFEMFGVSCACCASAQECLAFLTEHTAKLILLDINLVQESGFTLCKKIRETSDIPILFISARDSDSDVLIALNIGGDDYIKKPYSLSVLLAKVQVVLKRMEKMRQQEVESGIQTGMKAHGDRGMQTGMKAHGNGGVQAGMKAHGNGSVQADENGADKEDGIMRLAEEKLCVYLKSGMRDAENSGADHGGMKSGGADHSGMKSGGRESGFTEKEIPLKAKEFALLKCLYEHRKTIVTKEQLFLTVWGDAFYSDGTLNVHIRRLREKIEEDPSDPRFIKTIWGTGYMLDI